MHASLFREMVPVPLPRLQLHTISPIKKENPHQRGKSDLVIYGQALIYRASSGFLECLANRIGTSDFFFFLDTGQLRAFLPQGVNTSFELECFLYHLDPASRVAKW